MGWVAPVAMLVGGGLSAYSTWKSGDTAYSTGKANAALKTAQADYSEGKLSADVQTQRRTFRTFLGGLRADVAAIGGSTAEGTGLLMAQEAAVASKLDELNIITEAINTGKMYRAGAGFAEAEGATIRTQRRLGALGTAISSFGRAAEATGSMGMGTGAPS